MGRKESIRKEIDLSGVPRWGSGEHGNEGTLKFRDCKDVVVKGIYDDISFELLIEKYDTFKNKLKIVYENEEFYIGTNDLKKCQIGKILGKRTIEFKYKIGQRIIDDKRDLTITARIKIQDKKGQWQKYYKYQCNKCGFDGGRHWNIHNKEYKDELWTSESALIFQKQGCACCCFCPKIVVEYINSIVKTNSWMIPYFQGGYDEAKKYTKCSEEYIYPICIYCGRIKNNQIQIKNIYNSHSISCSCSDGIKYPNKFAYNLLEQLDIKFTSEYSPDWIKPKRYDFYFELNHKKYILEMDGGLGHGNGDNPLSGQSSKESQSIDDYKDEQAKIHGIEVIRIDCNPSEFEYIKQNVLKDERLNKLFDLNKINWTKVEEFALSNLVKVTCEYKRNNPELTTTEIMNLMNKGRTTIIRYLKRGTELGWCYYDGSNDKKLIEVFKNEISVGMFKSAKELEKQSEELFGIKLSNSGISLACTGKTQQYKGYTFKYISKEEYELRKEQESLKQAI